ncbi:MAG: hypothetical protein CSB44_11440 [Gammaproteobacteria bacterium]|nr:MAG: hypothetical protein CSB44_11440 [Gammaproteobacteria bacterium]
MRMTIFGVLALLMALFAAVQYNDPDGLWWACIYLVPAVWSLMAALRPVWFAKSAVRLALAGTILLALVGCVWYWPAIPHWWRRDVWWVVESAREGIGMMIVLAVLLAVATLLRRERPLPEHSDRVAWPRNRG